MGIISKSTAQKVEEYQKCYETANRLFDEILHDLSEFEDVPLITDISIVSQDAWSSSAVKQEDGSYVSQSGNCDFGYSGTVYIPIENSPNSYVAIGYIC